MEFKISKNGHYIDIINECDFKEGSIAFTASCFLNKNIDGEFKDFSLSEENESIVKVLVCATEMLSHLISLIEMVENEDIIVKDNIDNDGNESIFFKLYKDILLTAKKATQ